MHPIQRSIVLSLIITLSYCLSAQWTVAIPGNTIPISLQSLFILTLSCFLKPRYSLLSITLYILIGISGLPVFADGASGLAVVFGNTGGYLMGFIPAAFLMSWIMQKESTFQFGNIFFHMVLATLVIMFCGFSMLAFKIGAQNALNYGVIPFIPGGIIKAIIGSAIVYFALLKKIKAPE